MHDLKRHLTVKPGVGGEVHGGHAAVRDAGADVVPPVEHPPDEHVRRGRVHQSDFTAPNGSFSPLLITLSALCCLRETTPAP